MRVPSNSFQVPEFNEIECNVFNAMKTALGTGEGGREKGSRKVVNLLVNLLFIGKNKRIKERLNNETHFFILFPSGFH